MCEVCERIYAQTKPEYLKVFDSYREELAKIGDRAKADLISVGFLTMSEEAFSDEEKAKGLMEESGRNIALAAVTAYAAYSGTHNPDMARSVDVTWDAVTHMGWAAGYMASIATKN